MRSETVEHYRRLIKEALTALQEEPDSKVWAANYSWAVAALSRHQIAAGSAAIDELKQALVDWLPEDEEEE